MPWGSLPAVFGKVNTALSISCDSGQSYELSVGAMSSITRFPYGIDQAYLDAYQPAAFVKTHFIFTNNPTPVTSNTAEVTITAGGVADTVTLNVNADGHSHMVPVADFHTKHASGDLKFKVESQNNGNLLQLTRFDLMVDLPVHIGCFKDAGTGFDLGGKTEDAAAQSVAACLKTCASTGAYAVLHKGTDCHCPDSLDKLIGIFISPNNRWNESTKDVLFQARIPITVPPPVPETTSPCAEGRKRWMCGWPSVPPG